MISNKIKLINQSSYFTVFLRSMVVLMIITLQIFICLVTSQQAQAADLSQKTEVCDLFFNNNIQLYHIPIARTEEERRKGLSNRQDAGAGMLFYFNPPRVVAFWMRDTLMPLSIGFISEEGILLAIEDLKPHSDELHRTSQPIKYALELPKGDFQKKGIIVGAKLTNIECRAI